MIEDTIDGLARALAAPRSRRGTAGIVAGGLMAALGLDADAKRRGRQSARKKGSGKGKGNRRGKRPKPCPAGTKRCGKACIDVQSDPANCGACGRTCGAGDVCTGGTCGPLPPAGPSFTVSGRTIRDAAGKPVVLRGVNKMSVFDDEDPRGAISFPEIRKTGANTVRIVWGITSNLAPNGPKTNPDVLDALIGNARSSGLVPMIELHDATGDWSRLDSLVNYWVQPRIVSIIQKHREYLLVNIGNEVGDDTVSDAQFTQRYTAAVQRMRGAGIRTPLVIDAPDWGKRLTTLNATAAALLDADPDRNLIFSVHMYWPANGGATQQFIKDALQGAVNANYPLIVGEFASHGAFNPNGSICAEGGRVEYKTILAETQRHGIGWYAWEWGPGNGFNDPLCALMDMTTNRRFDSLQPGWATEVATTDPNSIKNTATSVF